MRVPAIMKEFASVFSAKGRQCWLVGGAIRDMLLGKPSEDFDAATDAPPEEVMGMFRSVIPTGIKHGTVTVRFKGHEIETTTFRTEAGYADGRHPDSVAYAADIREDLSRRDFTMNAIALDCASGRLLDPFGGEADIRSRVVRAVGDPDLRFGEDGLRVYRAVRFSSVLGFELEPATLAAIPRVLDKAAAVSAERVRDELGKILAGKDPYRGLSLLDSTGLLARAIPELSALRKIEQSPPHAFDALEHSFRACALASPRPAVRWGALLHDLGKAECRTAEADGTVRFIGHERVSARMAREILLRLKHPVAFADRVSFIISHHMTRYDESWTDAALRRLVSRVGKDVLPDLLDLLDADEAGLKGAPRPESAVPRLRERLDEVLASDSAFSLKDLALGGDDLIALGLPPGKRIGMALGELMEAVLDDPALNERERLMEIAKMIVERDSRGSGAS